MELNTKLNIKKLSDEELLEDYVEYVLGGENGSYEYLDKKTFEYIEVSDEIVERAINAFKERLKKKREKEKINEIGEICPAGCVS